MHGSAFLYFRDHHLAAYPGLRRDPLSPGTPFFARRQGGGSAGGPLIQDRVFWFANYERNNQDAVFAVTNNHPVFSKFDGIFANPLDGHQFNVRIDGRASDSQHVFVRYSGDRNETITPAANVGLPSNWQSIRNTAQQAQAGLTSIVTPALVNDLRVSFSQLDGAIDPIAATDCRDPVACVGAGATGRESVRCAAVSLRLAFQCPVRSSATHVAGRQQPHVAARQSLRAGGR